MTHAEILASIRLVAFSNMVYGQGQSVILKKIFFSASIYRRNLEFLAIFGAIWQSNFKPQIIIIVSTVKSRKV